MVLMPQNHEPMNFSIKGGVPSLVYVQTENNLLVTGAGLSILLISCFTLFNL